jgi:thiamine-monophosphate kinase
VTPDSRSESDFLDWLALQQQRSDFVRLAAGDDLAVLNWLADDLLLVGVDQVLDGVHFDSKVHTPRQIGRKAMNRNLSDCAAMACLPAAALVSAALPRGVGIDYAKELYHGVREAAAAFQCEVVGGDTASWDGNLAVTVSILGRTAGVAPITRVGAKPGDGIYVTGALGGSILGRHLDFVPRVHEARALAMTGAVTAMIDLSDGLSRDLPRICRASGCGATIDASRIPIHPDAHRLSASDRTSAFDHALHDGEDHELLFTASRDPGPVSGLAVLPIGTITSQTDTVLISRDGDTKLMEPRGWEHRL